MIIKKSILKARTQAALLLLGTTEERNTNDERNERTERRANDTDNRRTQINRAARLYHCIKTVIQ